jgi:antitoxin component YwqK of YwqJK toxin-antitoxin module
LAVDDSLPHAAKFALNCIKFFESISYENGYPNGTYRHFWPNGNLQYEVSINKGLIQGISKQYYDTGILYIEAPIWSSNFDTTSYINRRHSQNSRYISLKGKYVFIAYTKDSITYEEKVESVSYPQNYHGPFKRYWPNGNLMESSHYINGKQIGYTFYYHEDGTADGFTYFDSNGYFVCDGYRQPDGTYKIEP